MTVTLTAMAEMQHLSRDHRHDSVDSSPANGTPKTRKRSRKAQSDKKFDCKHEGCGKSYSRAEHLYRHQLNRRRSHALGS